MSECSCAIDTCDDDFVPLLRKALVRARKVHVCAECARDILAGESYDLRVYVDDRSRYDLEKHEYVAHRCVVRHKTCLDCASVREALFCTWHHGMLWEELDEEINSSGGTLFSSSCMRLLTPRARDLVCDSIQEYWESEEEGEDE